MPELRVPQLKLQSRQIHLDFHTGPWITDVGTQFDADVFGDMMADANVNSVTVFAKCHHGHLYYNTKHPARHPGLKNGLDLLAMQVEALHKRNIRAPIYLSVHCDEFAANAHPDWIALRPNGLRVGREPLSHEPYQWQIMDMSSPYQDFLYEQTLEVLKLFKPVDGIFFDMCWDQPSLGKYAKEGHAKRGLDSGNEKDREKYAHEVSIAYMKRFYKLVRDHAPQGTVYFNARPLWNMAEEAPMVTQVEIEALPTGGWGYMYVPTNVRFARNFGRPYMGMTARFHKCWADFGGIKPQAALEYEISQMMAHGAQCSIGDQMHPRGTLDRGAYELIGQVYKRVADREPWLDGAKPVTQIGVLLADDDKERGITGVREGVTRMLTQLKHQFDLILPDGSFDDYEMIILPDTAKLDAPLAKRLDAFIKKGGVVLATGLSGLNNDGTEIVWRALPV
ncbi:MAG: alpha-L-fucosidase, partial [Burkholderiales bacterium]|nr:alpha-L-fucosidase [Phycisphaerae bacterium]